MGVALAIGLSQPGLSLSSFHIIPIVVPALFLHFFVWGGGGGSSKCMSICIKTVSKMFLLSLFERAAIPPKKTFVFLNVEGHFMKTQNICTRTFGSHDSLVTLFSKKKL